MKFTYEHNGVPRNIWLEKQPDGTIRARHPEPDDDAMPTSETTFIASPLPDGGWLLRAGNQQIIAHVTRDGDQRAVHVDGRVFNLAKVQQRARGGGAKSGKEDLTAQMPGHITDVLVAEGDSVEAGQALIVMEAMKMEIRVSAPAAGSVTQLFVQTGDVVERGQALVELDEV